MKMNGEFCLEQKCGCGMKKENKNEKFIFNKAHYKYRICKKKKKLLILLLNAAVVSAMHYSNTFDH